MLGIHVGLIVKFAVTVNWTTGWQKLSSQSMIRFDDPLIFVERNNVREHCNVGTIASF